MSLESRLSALSPAKQALLRKRLAADVQGAGTHIPIAPRGDRIPASFSQQRMWLFQQMYPGAVPYNSQVALHFTGPLDGCALEQSLDEIVRRHEIYRTSLEEVDATLVQRIHEGSRAFVTHVDLSDLPSADASARARRLIEDHIARPFRLDSLPLVRWMLIRLDSQHHILLCMDHHAVTDGWSRNVVFKELMALYSGIVTNGRLPDLPPPRLQFADFAAWQRDWLDGADGQAQIDYWRRTLTGSPALLDLPYDRPHPVEPGFRGGHELMRLTDEDMRPLRRVTAAAQATMFMTVLAVFLVMLRRYSAADDVCVGTGIANRRLPDTDGLIGMVINTVVLRVDLSGNPTFSELVERVRRVTLESYSNQEAPFEKVVEAVAPIRRPGINPLHQVTFNFQNNPMPAMSFAGLDTRLERPLFNGSAKFDLYVAGWPRSEERRGAWQRDNSEVLLSWEYNTDVFDASTIRQMQLHFRNLLVEAGRHPDRPIADLRMHDAEEQAAVEEWSGAPPLEPEPLPVHAFFEEHAARTPDRIALVADQARLTYGELDARADHVTAALIRSGVRPGDLIGLCLDRSIEMVVCLLGILKAGAAYVPLDPGLPHGRRASLIAACRPRSVLTSRLLAGGIPDGLPAVIVEDIDFDGNADRTGEPGVGGDALAYVLFTSGSTGEPRAVAVPHRAVARLVRAADYARLDDRQTWLHVSPLAFDASTLDIWAPLSSGGRLVLMSGRSPSLDEIEHTIKTEGVTAAFITAGLFQVIAHERIETFAGLEQVITGGEVVSIDAVKAVAERFPELRIVHAYGPTENTTFTTCRTIAAEDLSRRRLPIGRPISGTTVYILDARDEPCPIGIAGELCTGGFGLARGYWNDQAATDERFFDHPRYGRLYRTGDFCRFLPSGDIEFIGRMDRQVKVRGHRIELGEVERALTACPGVGACVVDVRGESAADKTLAAYIVPSEADRKPDLDDLRSALRSRLPEYAQPSSYQFVERIPLTRNGKIDHQALASAALLPLDVRPAAARTPMEDVVASVWREVLGRQDLGIHDDFFALGGHSLAALRVLALIKARTGVKLQTLDFFRQPTVAGIAARAEKRTLDPEFGVPGSDGFLVELRGAGNGAPLFILPGGWGEADEILVFAGLLSHLKVDRPTYAVRSRALDRSRPVPERLEQHAEDILHAIAQVNPAGPFAIVGECAASSVAIAVAAGAEAAGRRLEAVILLDPGSLAHLRAFAARVAKLPAGLGPIPDLRSEAARVAKSLGVFGQISAWRASLRRVAASPAAGTPQTRPKGFPRRVAKYYELIGSWEPQPLRSPLHLVLSGRFPEVAAVGESWTSLALGPLTVHQVPGDHHSYIREQAAETARLLESILAGRV